MKQYLKEFLKVMSALIVVTILLILISFGIGIFGLKMYEYFAPKFENARRETFINNRSFQEGKMQELIKYREEYLTAKTNQEKEAIKSTINLNMTQINRNDLPPELQSFLNQLNGGY